jgi:CelD/BcsL family acetyltransferase involved in cellulose biosynthesis
MSTVMVRSPSDVASICEDIEAIAGEWDDLVTRCKAPLFVRPGWLRAWLDAFDCRDVVIYTVRRDGRLVALVPLLRGPLRGWLASPTNDHTPMWAPLAQDEVAAQALARAVLADRPSRLRLGILEVDTMATRHFVGTLERAGYRPVVHHREWSPYIDTTVTPDVFAKRFTAKARSSMRRRARRLDERGEVTFETCRGGDELRAVLDEGLAVEASGWKGRRGTAIACDPATLAFYRRVARWAGEHGWLLLTMLRVDRRIVAFSVGFDHDDVFYGLKIGYDERHAQLSPGLQLMHRTFDLALAGPTRMVDMLGDDDPYKHAASDGTHERITADWFAPTARSRATLVATTVWLHGRRLAQRALHAVLPEPLVEQLRTARAHTRIMVARLRRRRGYEG